MQPFSNRIELLANVGEPEVSVLDNPDDADVLPGAIGELIESKPENVISLTPLDIMGFEPVVIVENAIYGSGFNAKQYDGAKILTRRLFSGDVYLLRAVEDEYHYGDILYATQRPNGLYVSKTGEGRFIGWAKEDYVITSDMMDVVDECVENPSAEKINVTPVNLLRVRIGERPMSAVNPLRPVSLTWSVASILEKLQGRTRPWKTGAEDILPQSLKENRCRLSLQFSGEPENLKKEDIEVTVIHFTPQSQVFDSDLYVFVDPPTPEPVIEQIESFGDGLYLVDLSFSKLVNGELWVRFTVNRDDAKTGVVYNKYMVELPESNEVESDDVTTGPVVGYWGVAYPDLLGSATPTIEDLSFLTGIHKIYGEPRPISASFRVSERDWRKAGGEGEFGPTSVGRAFFVTSWDTGVSSIQKDGSTVSHLFHSFEIRIDGVDYRGYVSSYPIHYDGEPYSFYVDVK